MLLTLPSQGTHLSITTNPYQGLKLINQEEAEYWQDRLSITTNPYQGLKLANVVPVAGAENLSITTNPYQGLKVKDRFTVLTTTDLAKTPEAPRRPERRHWDG